MERGEGDVERRPNQLHWCSRKGNFAAGLNSDPQRSTANLHQSRGEGSSYTSTAVKVTLLLVLIQIRRKYRQPVPE